VRLKKIYHILIILLFLFSCAGKDNEKTSEQDKRKERPNILFILTDDQGYGDLGCHGNPYIKTPNLDRLARMGTEFTNFYASPVCSPTRASLMTGKYYLRTGIYGTDSGGSIMDSDELTIAEILKTNGYQTGIFGKWHLGDNYPSRPIDQGFTESLIHKGGGIGQVGDPINFNRVDSCYFNPLLYRNERPVKTHGYCTDIFTEAAIDFIEHNKENPFFVYLAYNAPHDPLQLPDEYYNQYKDLSFDKEIHTTSGTIIPKLNTKESECARRVYGMVANIDDNIGKLMNKLNSEDLLKNTVVIFMSDNGLIPTRYNTGLHGLKKSVYEGGIKVPFFIYYPETFKAVNKVQTAAAHIDVLPTLLELCHLQKDIPENIDGKSLLPILNGTDKELKNRTLFWQFGLQYPKPDQNIAVRKGGYKLVINADNECDSSKFELFNIIDDPGEKNNIIKDNKSVADSLKKQFDTWYRINVINEGNPKPQRIKIDMNHEDPAVLTRQDAKGFPYIWTRDDVFTWWNVEFEESGYYDFTFNFREKPGGKGNFIIQLPPIQYSTCNNDTSAISIPMYRKYVPKGRHRMEVFYRMGYSIIAPFTLTIKKNNEIHN